MRDRPSGGQDRRQDGPGESEALHGLELLHADRERRRDAAGTGGRECGVECSWRRRAVPPLPVADPAEERQHDEPLESPQVEPPRALPAAHRSGSGGRRRTAANASAAVKKVCVGGGGVVGIGAR